MYFMLITLLNFNKADQIHTLDKSRRFEGQGIRGKGK